MELPTTLSQTLMPGQRLIRVKGGYEAAEKYPFPRDCEAPLFDEDEDYCYIKKTDTNGATTLLRFKLEEEPIPHFDPKKYVTVDDFNNFREEMLNGFNDIRQAVQSASANNAGYNESKSITTGKPANRPNNGINRSTENI